MACVAVFLAIFSVGLATVGPAFWWGWVVCLAGQTLVAVTFGVLAALGPARSAAKLDVVAALHQE